MWLCNRIGSDNFARELELERLNLSLPPPPETRLSTVKPHRFSVQPTNMCCSHALLVVADTRLTPSDRDWQLASVALSIGILSPKFKSHAFVTCSSYAQSNFGKLLEDL